MLFNAKDIQLVDREAVRDAVKAISDKSKSGLPDLTALMAAAAGPPAAPAAAAAINVARDASPASSRPASPASSRAASSRLAGRSP